MCGLTGFLSQSWKPENEDILRRMAQVINHRGPDAEGFYTSSDSGIALGHRRLSIMDVSSAGAQPMRSSCQRYVMVYNGELYGHLALRSQLDTDSASPINWVGHSDSETLLALVTRYGVSDAISKLNGMFAIAIWDKKHQLLHLIRDRFGEKPLYIGRCANAVIFGSELRSIMQFPGMSTQLDSLAVARMIRYSAVPAPLSIYKDVVKVKPAHHVVFNHRGEEVQNECYWDINALSATSQQPAIDAQSVVEHLGTQLPEIVKSRMMSDVPLGAFLSGGVDSSLVVALMQRSAHKPVNTFTIGFEYESHNEAPYAKQVAELLETNHTELYVTGKEALDVVSELPLIFDEPFADSSQIPTILVSRLARKYVTVCLTGDGGDELFGGYRRYSKADTMWSRVNRVPGVIRNQFDLDRSLNVGALLSSPLLKNIPLFGKQLKRIDDVVELLGAREFDEFYDSFLAQRTGASRLVPSISYRNTKISLNFDSRIPRQQRMLQRDLLTYLHDVILTKVDRASMSCSLETRAPLLDPDLAVFATGLPWAVKYQQGSGKWPLVSVLKQYLPTELIERPKMGFGVPIHAWLRGPLRDWADDLLSESSLQSSGLLDVPGIRRMWALHKSGNA